MKSFGISGSLLELKLPPKESTPQPTSRGGSSTRKRKTSRQNSSDRVLALAAAFIEDFPAAISGQDGHGTLFRLCLALVKGFGLSIEVSFELILSRYNERCLPPWTEPEIRHKLQDAAESTEVEDGYLLEAPGNHKTSKSKGSRNERTPRNAWALRSVVPNAPLDLKIPGTWHFQDGGVTNCEDES